MHEGIPLPVEQSGAGAVRYWTTACPAVDPSRVLRVHGYSNPAKVRPAILKAANAIAGRAPGYVEAQGAWRRVAVESLAGGGVLRLSGGVSVSCPAFERLLAAAGEVVVFVLTLGPGFDRCVIELMERFEPLEALFMETAGRLAIEKLTRLLAAEIGRTLAGEGLTLGTRLGPGYTYRIDTAPGAPVERAMWPLEQQRELFDLFRPAPLPVELQSSSVMLPKMSRSGMIGVHRAG